MKRRFLIAASIAALVTMLGPAFASAADWGDLTVKFVYDGTPPAAGKLNANKDAFCIKQEIPDESLLVDKETKGIADIVVFMYLSSRDPQPPIHEDYKKEATAKIKFNNEKCRFEPHILPLMVSQTLVVANPDPVGHNTKIDSFKNPAQNFNLPSGAEVEHKFEVAESLPTPVSCSIHPWMKSYLLVKNNPYMGVTNAQGELTIKNVPTGKWRFRVWQEKAGYISKVKGLKIDKKGRFNVTIKASGNDLGTIQVSPKEF